MIEIKNAKITSTFLGREDHGIPTCFVHLDYGSSAQGFGGYDLRFPSYGIDFITKILSTLEVASWEKLPGTYCRAKADRCCVQAIGHITKDQWFSPTPDNEDTV